MSAAQYYSPVDLKQLDRVNSLFSEQANLASLLARPEFQSRPIEAADILQHALTPIAEIYTDGVWITDGEWRTDGEWHTDGEWISPHIGTDQNLGSLRIYSDIELLTKEAIDSLMYVLWSDPAKHLNGRQLPLQRHEILRLRNDASMVAESLSCVVKALDRYILTRQLPADDSEFVCFASRYQFMGTLAAEHFISSGGNYSNLALSLKVAARHAPERDQPMLGLVEQDGRIIARHFTYRGTSALLDGRANEILSISATSALPLISTSTLAEFEELINRPETREYHLQRFLEANPEILRSLGYAQCRSQVILGEPGQRDLIPDFILQKPGGHGFDILDLKLPRARIIANKPYAHVSHEISKAIAQLRAYRNYFSTALNRARFAREHNIEYLEPRLIVAIGRHEEYVCPSIRQEIEAQVTGIRILTYDELIAFARTRTFDISRKISPSC